MPVELDADMVSVLALVEGPHDDVGAEIEGRFAQLRPAPDMSNAQSVRQNVATTELPEIGDALEALLLVRVENVEHLERARQTDHPVDLGVFAMVVGEAREDVVDGRRVDGFDVVRCDGQLDDGPESLLLVEPVVFAHELEAGSLAHILVVLVEWAAAGVHVEDPMASRFFVRQTLACRKHFEAVVGVAHDAGDGHPQTGVGVGVRIPVRDQDPGQFVVEVGDDVLHHRAETCRGFVEALGHKGVHIGFLVEMSVANTRNSHLQLYHENV